MVIGQHHGLHGSGELERGAGGERNSDDYSHGSGHRHLFAELHQEGQTIVLVTHDPKLATRYAARVISMLDGRVIDDARLETTERKPADVIRVRSEEPSR